MQQYKPQGNRGLFDEEMNYELLSKMGNPLERISDIIDFGIFRSLLEDHLTNKERKSNAGAKPYDVVELRSQSSSKQHLVAFLCLCLRF